jgi:hypothetical protein
MQLPLHTTDVSVFPYNVRSFPGLSHGRYIYLGLGNGNRNGIGGSVGGGSSGKNASHTGVSNDATHTYGESNTPKSDASGETSASPHDETFINVVFPVDKLPPHGGLFEVRYHRDNQCVGSAILFVFSFVFSFVSFFKVSYHRDNQCAGSASVIVTSICIFCTLRIQSSQSMCNFIHTRQGAPRMTARVRFIDHPPSMSKRFAFFAVLLVRSATVAM